MPTPIFTLRSILFPFSIVYGLVVYIRNRLYDWEIFKSQSFDIPVICVGNITVGGTGKTPHVEYLIRLYQDNYNVAVLSRGYGRKTKGFLWVETTDIAENVGDEPLQMKQKFPHIAFAVDEKRARGIAQLQERGYTLVILDDAFQHRAVKPSKSIVLMDYNRLPHKDYYLLSGNLRDGRYALKRADIVLVTKCPKQLSEKEKQQILVKNKVKAPCFFTHFEYGDFCNLQTTKPIKSIAGFEVLLVTGIANPLPLRKHLEEKGARVKQLTFPDHHNYSENDLQKVNRAFSELSSSRKIIFTTEKDKVKLLPLLQAKSELLSSFYYVPIRVVFEQEGAGRSFQEKL